MVSSFFINPNETQNEFAILSIAYIVILSKRFYICKLPCKPILCWSLITSKFIGFYFILILLMFNRCSLRTCSTGCLLMPGNFTLTMSTWNFIYLSRSLLTNAFFLEIRFVIVYYRIDVQIFLLLVDKTMDAFYTQRKGNRDIFFIIQIPPMSNPQIYATCHFMISFLLLSFYYFCCDFM